MKFASCRIAEDRFIVNLFSKEYGKTTLEKSGTVKTSDAESFFRNCDYIDLVIPGREMLCFARNYPQVKSAYLKKIVAQDIESETPFKESDMLIEVKNFQKGSQEMNAYCIAKSDVRAVLKMFDDASREKVRSIVPEEVLLFKTQENLQRALFIGSDYSLLVMPNGQIVQNGGLNELKSDMLSFLEGEDPESELESWLSIAADLSEQAELSDIELRIRKSIIDFFEKTIAYFKPFITGIGTTGIFINDVMPKGTDKIIAEIDSSAFSDEPFKVFSVENQLALVPEFVDNDSGINFAVGDFAYKGGFTFLKKRIIIAFALYLAAFVMLVAGMSMRMGYLDERISAGETRTKTLMKEILGKEVPSVRQALSMMDKTIRGETLSADKKAVYPYSALYIMEQIFPYFTFENSTIEVAELSIKEEGKIRVVGTSNTLEDINKFTDLLDADPLIDEVNRGQINTRGDKSSFNISFSYAQTKKEDPKAKKGKKKSKDE